MDKRKHNHRPQRALELTPVAQSRGSALTAAYVRTSSRITAFGLIVTLASIPLLFIYWFWYLINPSWLGHVANVSILIIDVIQMLIIRKNMLLIRSVISRGLFDFNEVHKIRNGSVFSLSCSVLILFIAATPFMLRNLSNILVYVLIFLVQSVIAGIVGNFAYDLIKRRAGDRGIYDE